MKHQSPIPEGPMKHRSRLGCCLRFNACSGREKSNGVLHRRHAWHGRLRAERIGLTKETNNGQTQAEETKIVSCHETPHSCSRRCTQRKGVVASPVVRSWEYRVMEPARSEEPKDERPKAANEVSSL